MRVRAGGTAGGAGTWLVRQRRVLVKRERCFVPVDECFHPKLLPDPPGDGRHIREWDSFRQEFVPEIPSLRSRRVIRQCFDSRDHRVHELLPVIDEPALGNCAALHIVAGVGPDRGVRNFPQHSLLVARLPELVREGDRASANSEGRAVHPARDLLEGGVVVEGVVGDHEEVIEAEAAQRARLHGGRRSSSRRKARQQPGSA